MRSSLLLGAAIVALILSPAACGGSETTGASSSGMPEAGDGRYHPPGDGTHETEAEACDALSAAQSSRRLKLGCIGTSANCPDLLRTQFITPCLEYDKGSVQGCITYYNGAPSCADLNKAIDDCAVTPFPDTTSAGCM